MKTWRTCSWALDSFYLLCGLTDWINSTKFHRKGNNIIKCMQLHNVLLTHDSCKRAVLPQSGIQSIVSVDVCAGGIFKLASSLCFKQDSLCQDF